MFKPGAVKFESVDQGKVSEQKVEVTYAGRSIWKIVDVRGASDALEVELTQKQRYSGRVAYDLLVRLKDSAAAGYFNEQLVLVTNDEQNPRIPMHVAGRVVPADFRRAGVAAAGRRGPRRASVEESARPRQEAVPHRVGQ